MRGEARCSRCGAVYLLGDGQMIPVSLNYFPKGSWHRSVPSIDGKSRTIAGGSQDAAEHPQ